MASVQTLQGKRLKKINPDDIRVVFVDEAHHATAKLSRNQVSKKTLVFIDTKLMILPSRSRLIRGPSPDQNRAAGDRHVCRRAAR